MNLLTARNYAASYNSTCFSINSFVEFLLPQHYKDCNITGYTKYFCTCVFGFLKRTISYLLKIVGTTAIVSTLLTIVGQPYKPTKAGKGGCLGCPLFPLCFQVKQFLLHKYTHQLIMYINIKSNQNHMHFFLRNFFISLVNSLLSLFPSFNYSPLI